MKRLINFALVFAALSVVACSSDKVSDEPSGPSIVENPAEKRIEMTQYVDISKLLPDESRDNINNANVFALRLFDEVMHESEGNVCISPYSVYSVLSMIANGADENTSKELLSVLNSYDDNFTISDINAFNSVLLRELPIVDSWSPLKISNSIWHSPETIVLSEFKKVVGSHYAAEDVAEFPGGDEGMRKINTWVNEKTDGMIPEFLKEPIDAEFAVLNAIYFNGRWSRVFKEKDTKEAFFTNLDGTRVKTDFMNKEDLLAYGEYEGIKTLKMPYGNENFHMVLMMPEKGEDLHNLISSMNLQRIKDISHSRRMSEVTLSLPKFSASFDADLIQILGNIGLKDRTFDGIIDYPLYLSMVKHSSRLEVSEEGTIASAATLAGMLTSAGPMEYEQVSITFDRPFLYMIQEDSTGVILFMGAVTSF